MRKKLIFVGILIIITVLLFTVQALASDSQKMEIPSSLAVSGNTIDIGQNFPSANVSLQPISASYSPAITKEQALYAAREPLKEFFGVTNAETLPSAATLALFSGDAQDGRVKVEGVPVWVVVIKHVPCLQGGPAGGAGIDPDSSQLNVAIDAQTGVILHGVISSKVVSR